MFDRRRKLCFPRGAAGRGFLFPGLAERAGPRETAPNQKIRVETQGGDHDRRKAEALWLGPRRRRHDGGGAGLCARPLPREILPRQVRNHRGAAAGGSQPARAADHAAGLARRLLHHRPLRPRRACLRQVLSRLCARHARRLRLRARRRRLSPQRGRDFRRDGLGRRCQRLADAVRRRLQRLRRRRAARRRRSLQGRRHARSAPSRQGGRGRPGLARRADRRRRLWSGAGEPAQAARRHLAAFSAEF